MIICNDVIKSYGKEPNCFYALRSISISIPQGSFVAIIGRSGSGKSTLMNLLGSLDTPTSGSIIINSKDITKFTEKESSLYRNSTIGFVFQDFHLEPTYTVYENVKMPLLIANTPKHISEHRINSSLEKVNIIDKRNNFAKNLSGGEKQRTSIARALVNDPQIILADEPCGNLDVNNSQIIMRILKSLATEGKTVILVTHNLEDAKLADRRITLQDGVIISDES